ncbi:VanZ family protein [Vibrio harveyi]|uniref:VanZ family protein n=1 Tax=Vibrio harveyi TaxID=669 RepID=UPI000406897D|nr:VanZ family protein [Vibrio harveyi]ELV8770363.1 VanZ family protein [Vibrio harveyi]WHP65631.1 VanZ family protein [Vibrio harveyi]HDM8130806.1 VanZ family protein [Vibrio harveyi]HDM8137134.1 VanZ family protein [Vibrio harveyi]HDM8189202.1 VanZ family protein [Vibrio harveyi]
MTNTIARISFIGVLLLTISLSLWKSSDISHATYQNLENYVGGSSTLHFTFSLLIGFLAVFNFPKWVTATNADMFGIRLLIVLLFIVSLEEFSQLFIATRSFSFDDLSTNWIGIILGYFCAKLLKIIVKQ